MVEVAPAAKFSGVVVRDGSTRSNMPHNLFWLNGQGLVCARAFASIPNHGLQKGPAQELATKFNPMVPCLLSVSRLISNGNQSIYLYAAGSRPGSASQGSPLISKCNLSIHLYAAGSRPGSASQGRAASRPPSGAPLGRQATLGEAFGHSSRATQQVCSHKS